MKKNIVLAALLMLSAQISFSQVKSVDYSLRYNSETCLFDCFLIINEGSTKGILSRAQFNSQITVIIPVTSNLFIEESFMPLKDNQSLRSSDPVSWEISNELESPHDLPNSRFVSISPVLAPAAFYNDLNQGDEIKLFSFKVTPVIDCAKDVRLFENGKDPDSSKGGMLGTDFSNGFTIGSVEQKYLSNSEMIYPSRPQFDNVSISRKNDLQLNISASNPNQSMCQEVVKYDFYGPDGYLGDYRTVATMDRSKLKKGEYRVIATDEFGCTGEVVFYPFGKEEDQNSSTRSLETEISKEFISSIYPNPARDVINVTMSGAKGMKVQAEIFNLKGDLVSANVLNTVLGGGEESFKISSGLLPGMYNLALTLEDDKIVNHKILIIK